MELSFEGDTIWQKLWSLLRSILTLPRFDLFLQGTFLILTLLEGYCYLLLRRSAEAGLLPVDIEDYVFIGAACFEAVLSGYQAWVGRKKKNYVLSSWLFVTAAAGLLVLATPQPNVSDVIVGFCNGLPSQPLPSSDSSWSSLTPTMLIITVLLCSLCRVSVWAHGVTYLDDHDPSNGPYFYGIQISIRVSVGVNARSWFEGHSRSPEWWKGQLSLSMLILMFAILFTLFPKNIKGWKVEDTYDDSGFLETLGRLCKTKGLMTQTAALALLTTGLWGFIYNETDLVRARYHFESANNWSQWRNSRLVGDILRTFIIVYFVAIFRNRFSGRRQEGVKATTASKVGAVLALLSAIFFVVIAVLNCNNSAVQGLGSDSYVQPECSRSCGCTSESYGFAPTCVVDTQTTYFSPCHAGCTEYEDINGFLLIQNCSCAVSSRAVQGQCNFDSCNTSFTIYHIVYVNALALSSAALLMQGMVLLRAVRKTDKATAIGFCFGIITIVAHLPGHLLYNYINRATCSFSSDSKCLLHNEKLAPSVAGMTAALAFSSAILSVGAFFLTRKENNKNS